MTTQTTDYRREHDMMSTPDKWPRWPFLPLTQRVANVLQLGFIVAPCSDVPRSRLFIGNFIAPTYDKYIDYDSVDAIIADGWRVD